MLKVLLLIQVLICSLAVSPCTVAADIPIQQIQKQLVQDQIGSLLKNRNRVNDLYFIGFAPYSTEDVFMNEAVYVRNLFDLQYGTVNRSILLVNNPKSLGLYPAATLKNLGKAFQRIGSLINPDEDVVVLYITSHGDKGAGISLKFENAGVLTPEKDHLDAKSLLKLFEDNNIKWRVIFLLACYSGSFIDTLKNENTLIVTSASAQRPSFGCGHHGDFTQFGEAYFRDGLSKSNNLITTFSIARHKVEKLEKSLDLKPSEPQIFIGEKIHPLLYKIMH